MFNSQYYTCEQIDQRLLQGYLDDYNSQNNTDLTKEQFLTLLFNTIGRNSTVDNLVTQIGYYECDTAAGTAAKAITVANYNLFAGGSIKVKFVNKNTANNATLNLNSQGAKDLYYQGERASSTNSWDEGEVVEIYYDGTSYYANNVKGGSGSGVYDVSKEHPTSGPNSDGKFTLEYILNSNNVNELIPVNKRYPGMSIQFVSTSDNKYVQYRCIANEFTTDVTQWVDEDVIATGKSNADFSVDDEQGNSIVEFGYGHIKTKNFDSSQNATSSKRGLMSAEDKSKLDIIPSDAEANNTSTENGKTDFSVDDENNFAILQVNEGYPKTKNFDGKTVAAISRIAESSNMLYETVTVSIADYNNNLLDVYAAITPSYTKRYIILVPEGAYDVSSWFTADYINNSNQTQDRGLVLADYTKLLGVGSADKVILDWTQPDGSEHHLSYISTLNTLNWNELENLTVHGHNVRYAVHDDPVGVHSRHLRIKNCIFKVSGDTSRVWGAGSHGGDYDGIFENCKFIMEYYAPFASIADQRESGGYRDYKEPFVLHDYATNIVADSYLKFINCRFYVPYTNFRFYYDLNWEQVAYNSSYAQYDNEKDDYAINDCVNMSGNTDYSYKCLIAGTQVPPYAQGRPSINTGWGAEGATKTLYVEVIGSKLNTFIAVTKRLTRVTGFGNIMGEVPVMWGNSTEGKSVVIDII